MTAVYQHANDVALTFPFVDNDNNGITPTSISYRVLDVIHTEIVETTVVSVIPGDAGVEIIVLGADNTLNWARPRDMRSIELVLTTTTGTFTQTQDYVIQMGGRLNISVNSAQTYEEAVLNGMDMPQAVGWAAQSRSAREAALIEAYHRLGKLRYRIKNPTSDSMSHISYPEAFVNSLLDLTEEELKGLDANFLVALKKAQVIEADTILNGDIIDNHRRSGLMSQTVGESSQMFRPGKPLIMPVSARTLRYLTGYINHVTALGRG